MRKYVQLKHTSGRSRRQVNESDVSDYESHIDAMKKTISIVPFDRYENKENKLIKIQNPSQFLKGVQISILLH